MSKIDALRRNYQRICGLPWDRNVAGAQRVWLAVYDKEDKLMNDSGKLASERSQLLKSHCGDILSKRKLLHGVSKEDRKFDLHFGADPPAAEGATIPVWVRDGWDVEEKTILADARSAGENAAVVFGFIPRKKTEELKRAVSSHYAATTTLHGRGTPTTPEGIEARKAIETTLEHAQRSRDQLLDELLNDTAVYIAGGDPVPGILLENKVQDAAKACLDRLYHRSHEADSPDWHKAIERSKKGDGDALEAVGHMSDPQAHPVCAAILTFVGSGKKGTEIRKQFTGPPYGWPQDAIDAALIVLTNAGLLPTRSGGEAVAKGKLDQKTIATTEFRVEIVTLSKVELIKIRGLLQKVGLNVPPNQESAKVADFTARMKARAEGAGGDPPRPKRPDTTHLEDIAHRVGNDQLKAIHDHLDRLTKEAREWQARQEAIAQREPRWRDLKALLEHAADLPVSTNVRGEVGAIEANRALLADPDPVPGLVVTLTQALREAMNQAHARCWQLIDEGNATLDASPTWEHLADEQRATIRADYRLDDRPEIAVGCIEEVLKTLQATKLKEWKNLCDAIPTRFSQALAAAAMLLEPKAQHVKLPSGTIKGDDDLKSWLILAEEQIREGLKKGPVILG